MRVIETEIQQLIDLWELLARCADAYEKLSIQANDSVRSATWRKEADTDRYHAKLLKDLLDRNSL